MIGAFDYLFLTLMGAGPLQRRLAQALAAARTALGAEGAALFTPQLGWAGNEAAILAPSGGNPDALVKALGDLIAAASHERLNPVARPENAGPLQPGGIYVHRWFTVGTGDVGEFVRLSAQAWPSFEKQFEARIFALFQADRTAEDVARDQVRLLLLTRYKDHGVWEASRDPTSDAMQIFARRQAITRWTKGCSTLLSSP